MTRPEPLPPLRDAAEVVAPPGRGERVDFKPQVTDQAVGAAPTGGDLRTVSQRVHDVCPYLLSEDGASRRLGPWRGHRCMAVRPPARLALDKQKRLCLIADHLSCATYVTARSGSSIAAVPLAGPDLERVTRWSITRTTASVVEPGSRLDGLTNRLSGTAAQAILGGALLVALLALARGQFAPGGSPTASPSPGSATSPSPTAMPDLTATPAATDVAEVTLAPTPVHTSPPATATPLPSHSRVYTVKAGDTLWDIALAYGTTVKAIQQLNGLGSNSRLEIGRKLLIP